MLGTTLYALIAPERMRNAIAWSSERENANGGYVRYKRSFREPDGESMYPWVHLGLFEGWRGECGDKGECLDSSDQQ